MPIIHYESLHDFHASLPEKVDYQYRDRDQWAGNQTYEEAKLRLWSGDADALEVSNSLLEKLEADGIELSQSYWDTDRTGFIPCIPSYLAGSPESMRRMVEHQSENAPIRIFTDVCLSASFGQERLARRGAVILALIRKLQAIRPVELYLIATMHGSKTDKYGACAIPVIKIHTSPLDLTSASYAMANAGFLRRLCFPWGRARGFNGSWAWNGNPSDNRKRLTEYLEVQDQDMLIDGAYATDELMREPLQWVNNQVKRYAHTVEDL